MRVPRMIVAVLVLLAALLPRHAAAQAENFNFPQNHDPTFGNQLGIPPLGNFDWWLEGHGVRGRRATTGVEVLQAFGFNLVFQDSCFGAGTNMFVDIYVNDRQVGSEALPNNINACNFALPPIQKVYDLSSNPIAGLGNGREFEVRFQIRGAMTPLSGFFTFYRIDINAPQVSFAGVLTGDEEPPPPPPPPVDEHGNVIARIATAETNLAGHVSTEGATTRSAVQSVRDALGIVENNVNASIAGAVLKVNAETALGISNLATQLGVQTQDLALAIQGNGNAVATLQKALEEKLLPEVLRGQDLTKLTAARVEEVGNSFFEKTLGQVLSAGTGIVGLMSGGSLLPVASFVQKSIMEVVNGNLRPDRIAKKAMAEFNRGVKKLKKLFSMGPAFSLPWERGAVEAITFGFAAETVDIPEFPVEAIYDRMLGADKEEDNAYGAYVWFERAYQTLVRPEEKHDQHDNDCRDPKHRHYDRDRDEWDRERTEWDKKKQDWEREKKDLEKKNKGGR
jgi:hypothetical protein